MVQVQQQVKGCMEDWTNERPVSSDQICWDVFIHYSGYYIKFLVKQSLLMFLSVVLYGACVSHCFPCEGLLLSLGYPVEMCSL